MLYFCIFFYLSYSLLVAPIMYNLSFVCLLYLQFSLHFFFFLPCFFRATWRFPGYGSNQSCSCWGDQGPGTSDWTHNLMVTSRIRSCCATTGTPSLHFFKTMYSLPFIMPPYYKNMSPVMLYAVCIFLFLFPSQFIFVIFFSFQCFPKLFLLNFIFCSLSLNSVLALVLNNNNYFKTFYWSRVDLQCCGNVRCTAK